VVAALLPRAARALGRLQEVREEEIGRVARSDGRALELDVAGLKAELASPAAGSSEIHRKLGAMGQLLADALVALLQAVTERRDPAPRRPLW
jgi:hypothetical protein